MSRTHERPSPSDFPALVSRQLDWSELDVLGHANNARYFTWFEEARMRYFQGVGVPVDDGLGWGPILAHTECSFLSPVTWPAALLLGARARSVGRSSITMEYAVFVERSEGPDCVAIGSGVVVLLRYETGEKIQIDEALRARLLTTTFSEG